MKTRNLLAALACSACLTVTSLAPVPVMADASKIVTLGADLTDDQKNTMMKYFNTSSDQVQIIYVTNSDERSYLGNYIPSSQIGTRTLSCAYVKPTQSGGIKVRTANLNYVTCNMIASALSTAGITNCEVVAACPFEVSGTGALTGVMMAYENSTGSALDSTKKDLATQEVVVTGNVGQQIGQDNATNIINQAKLQIIADNVQNADEIYNIVNNIAVENNVSLSDDEMNTIVSLLQQIAQQTYDIQSMKATLEDIQQNLDESMKAQSGETTVTPTPTAEADQSDAAASDSADGEDITQGVNSSALQENGPVIESSTEDANLAADTGYDTNSTGSEKEDTASADENGTGIPAATEDGTYTENTDASTDAGTTETTDGTAAGDTAIPEATNDGTDGETAEGTDAAAAEGTDETTAETADGTAAEGTDTTTAEGTDASAAEGTAETTENDMDTSLLSEDSRSKFESAQKFFQGEYKADLATLQQVEPEVTDVSAIPVLDSETADKLIENLEHSYYDLLRHVDAGTVETYTADGTETTVYNSNELNFMVRGMKTIFGMFDDVNLTEDDILYNVSLEDRSTLFADSEKFFATLYGENTDTAAAEETTADTASVDGETAVDETAIDETAAEEAVY